MKKKILKILKKNLKTYKKELKRIKIAKRISIIILIICFINFCWVSSYTELKYSYSASSNISKRVNIIGKTVGLKLYTDGVLVIGMSEVQGRDGNYYKPYENSGIKEGDMIKSINGEPISTSENAFNAINNSKGESISIRYQRASEEIYTTIIPILSNDNLYMIGLWIRDAAAGIGTLTYYEESTGKFAALGHGINDVDTGSLLNISNGELVTSQIVSIVKGDKGKPGEIRGTIDDGIEIGNIEINSKIGVYGIVNNIKYINSIKGMELSVANRSDIREGKATIICELSTGKTEEYEIEIKRVYRMNYKDNKSMLIKITDKDLIEKTGGIIPGMSGTPIIQNGKFIGAITNVMVI